MQAFSKPLGWQPRAAAADADSAPALVSPARGRRMRGTSWLDQAGAGAGATPTRGGQGKLSDPRGSGAFNNSYHNGYHEPTVVRHAVTPAGIVVAAQSTAATGAAAGPSTAAAASSLPAMLQLRRDVAQAHAAAADGLAAAADKTCQWMLQPCCPSGLIACVAEELQTVSTSAHAASAAAAAAAAASAAAMPALPPAALASLLDDTSRAAAAAAASAAAVAGALRAVRNRWQADVAAARQPLQGGGGEVEVDTEEAAGGEGGQEPPSAEGGPSSAEAAGEGVEGGGKAVGSGTDVRALLELVAAIAAGGGEDEWEWQSEADPEAEAEAEGAAGGDDGGGYDLHVEGGVPTTARIKLNDPRGSNTFADVKQYGSADEEQYGGPDGNVYGSQDEEQYWSQDEEQHGGLDEQQYGGPDEQPYGGVDQQEQYGGPDQEQYGGPDQEQYGGPDQELAQMAERHLVILAVSVKWDDIAGLAEAKRVLAEAVVLPTIMPEHFTGIRRPVMGVLLSGPPGNGKALLAEAAATESVCTLFHVSPASLANCQGDSEHVVRVLFDVAREMAPSIIFIDEVDSLCSQRGGANDDEASRRFKSELLTQIVKAKEQAKDAGGGEAGPSAPKRVFVVGATNRPWDEDEKVRRCFEKRVYVPLPDLAQRLQLLYINLKNVVVAPELNLKHVAAKLVGYSGHDISNVCREAALEGMRRAVAGKSPAEILAMRQAGHDMSKVPVTFEDFAKAIREVPPSVSEEDVRRHEEWMAEFGRA